MFKNIMNVKEVADYLGFGVAKIYELAEARDIPAAKIKGQYRFVKELIDGWLKENALQRTRQKELGTVTNRIRGEAKRAGFNKLSTRQIEIMVNELRQERAS
jgi:excisionase family DNA binding protein